MGSIFNYTTDFNRVMKPDVSELNLPPLRKSVEKVCFIYIIFHGVSRGYETVSISRVYKPAASSAAIGLHSKPIATTSIDEQLCLHGSGCHARRRRLSACRPRLSRPRMSQALDPARSASILAVQCSCSWVESRDRACVSEPPTRWKRSGLYPLPKSGQR